MIPEFDRKHFAIEKDEDRPEAPYCVTLSFHSSPHVISMGFSKSEPTDEGLKGLWDFHIETLKEKGLIKVH